MPTTVEELRTVMRMELGQYQKDLTKLMGVNAKTQRDIENTWRAANKRLDGVGKSMARSLVAPLAGIAAAASVREVLAYADAWTRAKNSLAVAGITGRQQAQVLDQLYESAQKNAAPIEALAGLFGRAAQASDNLGASQADLIKFSDGVATALRVAGTGAGEASGALTQLGQLLGSARVQAGEFNSVNEGARPILIDVANGLDEAGGSVNRLKQLVNDGKVSGQQFFQAFLKGLPTIQSMAANAAQTIDQGFTKVNNALTKYIGETDSSLGASQRLIAGLNALADNFDKVADVTLMVASVIAGALVGRSIVGMISSLGLGTAAVVRFTRALAAARSMAQVGIALNGVAAAAGPVGIALGTVAAGAALYFGSQAVEASERTERLREEMRELGILSEELAPKVDGAAKSLENLAGDEVRRRLLEINDELDRMNSRSWGDLFGFGGPSTLEDVRAGVANVLRGRTSSDDKAAARGLQEIIDLADKGEISLEDARKKLDEISKIKVSEGVDDLIAALRKALPYVRGLQDYMKRVQTPGALTAPDTGRDWSRLGAAIEDRDKRKAFLDQRDAEAMRTDLERDIDVRTKAILKAAEDLGVKLGEAAARIQAKSELATEAVVKANAASVSSAAEVIRGYESFRAKPHWDVNAYRVGFGSDTVTLDDGSVQKVTQGISVTLADANRDLDRRIAEFQAGIRGRIGAGTFDAMSSNQQAALTSIAYNYGSLPDRIVDAIKTGNDETVYRAIKELATDNGGINRSRRNSEAELFLNGSSNAVQTDAKSRDAFEEELKQQRQRLQMLKEETALQASLNPLVNDYGRAMSELQAAQYLLTAAQQEGTAAGRELSSAQQLLAGNFANLTPEARAQAEAMRQIALDTGSAEAAQEQFAESQRRTAQAVEDFNQTAKDITSGFISDLRNGKSAAEAFGNALNKIADKLIDMSLNDIFGIGQQGGGSGIFGGLLSSIFGFGGGAFPAKPGGLFSDGGWTGAGGKYQAAGIVHRGEYVFDQDAVRRAGGPGALEALRKSLKGYANGGLVGLPSPSLPKTGSLLSSQVRYVEVPYIAETTVSDDGRLDSRIRKVSGETFQRGAPQVVNQSVAAVGKRSRMTKSYLGI